MFGGIVEKLACFSALLSVCFLTEVGGKEGRNSERKFGRIRRKSDSEDMVIFEGEIGDKWNLNGMFNTPYFDQEMKTNFTVQVGHSVKLPCIVRQIGSKTVSWIRKSDSAILSVDDMLVTYTDRISIQKTEYLAEWGLSIKNATPSDSGEYECQVSSEPKLSKSVNLLVQVPVLWIEGSPSILASAGSNISLKCSAQGNFEGPNVGQIVWQHEAADGSLRTLTERRGRVVRTGPGSWLLLKVGLSSAGNYSCSTHQSNTATVTIIVVQGELAPEAMLEEEVQGYTSTAVSSSSVNQSFIMLILLFLAFWISQLLTKYPWSNYRPKNWPPVPHFAQTS